MRKRWFLIGVIFSLMPWLIVGCGIAQEVHDAVVAERDSLVADIQSFQGELDATKSKLQSIQSELDDMNIELKSVTGELDITKSDAELTKSELTAKESELQSVQSELGTVKIELEEALAQLVEDQASVAPIAIEELKVHFIDVGQGDSILIDLGRTEILIDGGGKSSGVVSYLNDYVDDGVLEVMIATHPHADHIGGLIAVLAEFEVKEVWHNGDTRTTQTYSQFMSAVNSENAKVIVVARGNVIEVDGLTLKVLNPVEPEDSTNNNSIVLHLAFGEIDFLFTGDAEQEAETDMLNAGLVPDVEILKVGHHGSKTASSKDFLAIVSPEVAIYMAGEDNRYGHPHQETIDTLTEVGAEIYGTDVNGTITVTTDGEEFSLKTGK